MVKSTENNLEEKKNKVTNKVNWKEVGYVTVLADGVARIMGLTKLQAREFVIFGVVTALGNAIDGLGKIDTSKSKLYGIDVKALGIISKKKLVEERITTNTENKLKIKKNKINWKSFAAIFIMGHIIFFDVVANIIGLIKQKSNKSFIFLTTPLMISDMNSTPIIVPSLGEEIVTRPHYVTKTPKISHAIPDFVQAHPYWSGLIVGGIVSLSVYGWYLVSIQPKFPKRKQNIPDKDKIEYDSEDGSLPMTETELLTFNNYQYYVEVKQRLLNNTLDFMYFLRDPLARYNGHTPIGNKIQHMIKFGQDHAKKTINPETRDELWRKCISKNVQPNPETLHESVTRYVKGQQMGVRKISELKLRFVEDLQAFLNGRDLYELFPEDCDTAKLLWIQCEGLKLSVQETFKKILQDDVMAARFKTFVYNKNSLVFQDLDILAPLGDPQFTDQIQRMLNIIYMASMS